jgi:hypothetical protein
VIFNGILIEPMDQLVEEIKVRSWRWSMDNCFLKKLLLFGEAKRIFPCGALHHLIQETLSSFYD